MRFYAVLLATVIVFATTYAALTYAKVTTPSIAPESLSDNYHDAPAARVLRTHRTQDGEEREIRLLFVSKLVEWIVSPKTGVAKKLALVEKLKVQQWLKRHKTPGYVFKKLKLNGGLDKVITNPKLHIYAAFIDRYNNQNPTKKLTVLGMFTKTYGDDAVIKLLGTENNIATTGHFTSRLRTELATSWVDTGKTAEDTFTLLKLDKTAYKIFTAPPMHKGTTNPALDLYVAYVCQFNEHAKKTKKKKIGLLDMFSKTYGDNGVAKMVEMGVRVPTTQKVSSNLRRQLLRKWEINEQSPEDVFKLLKLDEAGNDLFATPQMNTWYSFIKNGFNRDGEDFHLVLLRVLAKRYGEDGLSKNFIVGNRRMDLLGYIPMNLENAMVNRWLATGKTSDDVFEMLRLNKGVDNLLTNPNLGAWYSYWFKFNSQNPEEATAMVHTITRFYSFKDLSVMLEKAKNAPSTAKIATKWQSELNVQKLRATRIKREG
ncbi:hypothetical protein PI124_g14929 [Phytophthora idaei]|nr:hypothetical protein PI125_g14743 [Phytophthora idaei]KAG3138708.1 hypothetical protein PI126_g16791 [Phytophthora idaei]KAG3240167.1 hypothetical protein PI124_g14929 [Phytophthora idaei]